MSDRRFHPQNSDEEGNMKARNTAIILGIGFFLCSGSLARAQLGELGKAAEKGASEAAKQELMKQAGLPTAGTPAVTPAATPGEEGGAANAPAGEAAPAAAPESDTEAPADE
jgi:hypothetical protein